MGWTESRPQTTGMPGTASLTLGSTPTDFFRDKKSSGAYLLLPSQHCHYVTVPCFRVVIFKILNKDSHLLARAMYLWCPALQENHLVKLVGGINPIRRKWVYFLGVGPRNEYQQLAWKSTLCLVWRLVQVFLYLVTNCIRSKRLLKAKDSELFLAVSSSCHWRHHV